jgi:hypothetical protein
VYIKIWQHDKPLGEIRNVGGRLRLFGPGVRKVNGNPDDTLKYPLHLPAMLQKNGQRFVKAEDNPDLFMRALVFHSSSAIQYQLVGGSLIDNIYCPTGPGGGIDPSCEKEQQASIHQPGDTPPMSKGTQGMYKSPEGQYTSDREATVHKRALKGFMKDVTAPPDGKRIVYMTGGGYGSGKSSALLGKYREQVGIPSKSEVPYVDPDHAKEYIPELEDRRKAGDKAASTFVHEESADIARVGLYDALHHNRSVVYDTSGDGNIDWLEGKIHAMRQAGAQKIIGNYATPLDPKEAYLRVKKREAAEGNKRVLTPDQVESSHARVAQTWLAAAHKGIYDELNLWANDGPEGSPPRKIATAVKGQIHVLDQRAFNKFQDMARLATNNEATTNMAQDQDSNKYLSNENKIEMDLMQGFTPETSERLKYNAEDIAYYNRLKKWLEENPLQPGQYLDIRE